MIDQHARAIQVVVKWYLSFYCLKEWRIESLFERCVVDVMGGKVAENARFYVPLGIDVGILAAA
jgi:hypothetical protein